jgi:hydrogenase maturation protease
VEKQNDILLIGAGNMYRSDDALGLCAAREVARRMPGRVVVKEVDGGGTSMLEAWEGAETVLIIDAVRSGEPAGTLCRIDASTQRLPLRFLTTSSHSFGVAQAIETARELHRLPRTIIVYGIEGSSFEQGTGLSDPVIRSMPALIAMIEHDIAALQPATNDQEA